MKRNNVFIFAFFVCIASVKAQTTEKKIVTDIQEGVSYYTDITDNPDGSAYFCTNANEEVNTPEDPDNFRIVAGPRHRERFTIYNEGMGQYIVVSAVVCDGANIWPCAIISNPN